MRSLLLATLGIFGLFWLSGIANAQDLIADLEKQPRSAEVRKKLHEARIRLEEEIRQGDMRWIRLEIAAGLDPFEGENRLFSMAAFCSNRLAIAQLMVRAAKPEHRSDRVDMGLWNCVAEHRSVPLAKTLLELGPKGDWGLKRTQIAIDAGAISLFKNDGGTAAVAAAVRMNNMRLARALLLANETPASILIPLLNSAIDAKEPQLFKTYLTLDSNPTLLTSSYSRSSLLKSAIMKGEQQLVEPVLQMGAEVDTESLQLAAEFENKEILIRLIGLKTTDPWPFLSLLLLRESHELLRLVAHHAIYVPQRRSINDVSPKELARDLLSGGIDPFRASRVHPDQLDLEARTPQGRTGLTFAALKGHKPLVTLYLQAGAQVDAQDHEGKTALMIAAANRNLPMMSLLRKAGASDEITDKAGHRAADAFWSSRPSSPYFTEDGVRAIKFELPEGFGDSCNAPEGRGLLCGSQENFETELLVRQVRTPKGPSPSSDNPNEPKITAEQEKDRTLFVASGKKRDYEVIVKARGPLGFAPEVRWLSRSLWQSVVPPPSDDVILKGQMWALINNFYLRLAIGLMAIVALVGIAVLARKSSFGR